MSGFIAVSRAFWDDPDFRDSEMSQREAFLWLVAEAAWKPRTKRVKATVVNLNRGQLAASTRFLAAAFRWSEARVRRYLDMLKNRRTIDAATDAGVTVITIRNYDKYQTPPKPTDALRETKSTQQRRTSDANLNQDNHYTKKELLPAVADDWKSDQEFVDLWERWKATPNGAGRSKTPAKIYPIFCRHRKQVGITRIMAGVTAYFDHDDFKLSGGKGLDPWLNDKKYEAYADQAKPKIVKPRNHVEELRALGMAI